MEGKKGLLKNSNRNNAVASTDVKENTQPHLNTRVHARTLDFNPSPAVWPRPAPPSKT